MASKNHFKLCILLFKIDLLTMFYVHAFMDYYVWEEHYKKLLMHPIVIYMYIRNLIDCPGKVSTLDCFSVSMLTFWLLCHLPAHTITRYNRTSTCYLCSGDWQCHCCCDFQYYIILPYLQHNINNIKVVSELHELHDKTMNQGTNIHKQHSNEQVYHR